MTNNPPSAPAQALNVSPGAAVTVRSEESDDYHAIVARLNADWRVIVCAAGLQWVLQRRGSPKKAPADDWRGRSFCRTSEALIRCSREHAGEIEPAALAILAALPERIDDPAPMPEAVSA
jgi:hypothetical protein